MSEAENNENIESAGGRIYEVGYLLVPTMSEETIPEVFGNIKSLIEKNKGEIISSDMPRMIYLSYVMTKVIDNVKNQFDSAYFGWVKFETEAEKVALIKKELASDKNIIRFLIIKTVRENTIAPKRYAGSGVGRMRAPEKKEENAAPIDEKEIDKEIDALAEAAV